MPGRGLRRHRRTRRPRSNVASARDGPGKGQATRPLAERQITVTAVELGRALADRATANVAGFENVRVLNTSFEAFEPAGERFDGGVHVQLVPLDRSGRPIREGRRPTSPDWASSRPRTTSRTFAPSLATRSWRVPCRTRLPIASGGESTSGAGASGPTCSPFSPWRSACRDDLRAQELHSDHLEPARSRPPLVGSQLRTRGSMLVARSCCPLSLSTEPRLRLRCGSRRVGIAPGGFGSAHGGGRFAAEPAGGDPSPVGGGVGRPRITVSPMVMRCMITKGGDGAACRSSRNSPS